MKPSRQRGFTLIELLIALALVLVVLVGVQRYIAGVTIDHQGISERRSQATQTRIALSNMQRDVAQAGYVPYADASFTPTSPVGVMASNNVLIVASYQPASTDPRDCNNQKYTTKGWVYVENIYKISAKHSLVCEGNGGNLTPQPVLSDVQQMVVSNLIAGTPAAIDNVRMIRVCIVTFENWTSIGDVPTTTMCDGVTRTPTPKLTKSGEPSEPKKVYFKTIADMPVLTSSFKAGQ